METKPIPTKKGAFFLSLGLIGASFIYAFSQQVGHTQAMVATSPPPSAPHMKTAVAIKKISGTYVNGAYIGSAVDAYYGTVQVKAIVQNGQLADVTFLQYPNSRSNSIYINSQAMPMLTQEAIQIQSANVNGVSGATFTSQAFQQSLRSALMQA